MSTPSPDPTDSLLINGILIPCNEVQLIVGENGFTPNAAHFYGWKRTIVVTADNRHTTRDTPPHNALWFKQWLNSCPNAAGLRPDGSVILPRIVLAETEDPFLIISAALKAVRREFGIQIRKITFSAAITMPLILADIFISAAQLMGNPRGQSATMSALLLMVLFEIFLLLLIRAFILIVRRARASRTVRYVLRNYKKNPDLLTPLLITSTVPPSQNAPISLFPSFFALLSVMLFCFPFAGILFSLIALALVFRTPCWPRTLSIIGLTLSTLFTSYVMILLHFAH